MHCAYKHGEMYGLTHDPSRFERDGLRPKTSVKGLYLTGQDVMTCGVGGAMAGGFVSVVSVLALGSPALLRAFASNSQSVSGKADVQSAC